MDDIRQSIKEQIVNTIKNKMVREETIVEPIEKPKNTRGKKK